VYVGGQVDKAVAVIMLKSTFQYSGSPGMLASFIYSIYVDTVYKRNGFLCHPAMNKIWFCMASGMQYDVVQTVIDCM